MDDEAASRLGGRRDDEHHSEACARRTARRHVGRSGLVIQRSATHINEPGSAAITWRMPSMATGSGSRPSMRPSRLRHGAKSWWPMITITPPVRRRRRPPEQRVSTHLGDQAATLDPGVPALPEARADGHRVRRVLAVERVLRLRDPDVVAPVHALGGGDETVDEVEARDGRELHREVVQAGAPSWMAALMTAMSPGCVSGCIAPDVPTLANVSAPTWISSTATAVDGPPIPVDVTATGARRRASPRPGVLAVRRHEARVVEVLGDGLAPTWVAGQEHVPADVTLGEVDGTRSRPNTWPWRLVARGFPPIPTVAPVAAPSPGSNALRDRSTPDWEDLAHSSINIYL